MLLSPNFDILKMFSNANFTTLVSDGNCWPLFSCEKCYDTVVATASPLQVGSILKVALQRLSFRLGWQMCSKGPEHNPIIFLWFNMILYFSLKRK